MQLITADALTGFTWHYEDGWYYQMNGQTPVSRLSLKNFPNPFDVWEKKVDRSAAMLQRTLTNDERETLKPRNYVFTLWEHRQANYEAE